MPDDPWTFRGAGDGNRTRIASLEGFGSGDAGQPERRSSDVASCPRVTVIAPVSPADRARSGHASVEVAYYGLTSAPWSSSSPGELRITRVFSCVAHGFKARASFMFAGCCWWRSLAIDGCSGTSRGHGSVMRRPDSRWDGTVERPSAFQP